MSGNQRTVSKRRKTDSSNYKEEEEEEVGNESGSDVEFEDDNVNEYGVIDPHCTTSADILIDLYQRGALPLKAETIQPGMQRRMGNNQPHKYLYSWATRNRIKTDSITMMRMVCHDSGIKVRKAVKRNGKICLHPTIAYLNGKIEQYFELLNHRMSIWPSTWTTNSVLFHSINCAVQFELGQLHDRLRKLVSQRGSDISTTERATSCYAVIPPAVFFTVMPHVMTGSREVLCLCDDTVTLSLPPSFLDVLFPPSEKELESDDKFHPYFKHSLKTRWYCQYFSLDTKVTGDDGKPIRVPNADGSDSGEIVYRSVKQEVSETLTILYTTHDHRFTPKCSWKGSNKMDADPDVLWRTAKVF